MRLPRAVFWGHRQVESRAKGTSPCKGQLRWEQVQENQNPVTVPSCHIPSACRDLSWNAIRSIHPEAFATLRSLVKL